MKSIKLFAFSCILSLIFAANVVAAEGKIGYVDLSLLFDEYYKTKSYDKVLENDHNVFEQERNTRIEKIKEAQNKLGLLSDDKKKTLEKEIEQLKADLLEFDSQQKTDLTKQRNEKIREILLEIEKIVSDYAKKEKYSVILNDRVLIYADQSINLTDTMLGILNANQPK